MVFTLLFVVEILFYLSFRYKTKALSVIILLAYAVVAYLCFKFCRIHLPWGGDTALTAIVFYGAGHIFKNDLKQFLNQKLIFLLISILIAGILFTAVSTLNGRVDMLAVVYNNYTVFIAVAFIGIVLCLLISRLLDILFGRIAFVEYISKNTIIILAFHSLALTVIKAISAFVFKYPASSLITNVILIPFIAIIAIVLLIPVMYLYDRYYPLLVNQKSSKPVA
jgi:acyltransferase